MMGGEVLSEENGIQHMRTFFGLIIMFMMLIVLAACSVANPTSNTASTPTQFPQPSFDLEDLEHPLTVTAKSSYTSLWVMDGGRML
jgi:uncharacterized lipoprotein